MNYGNLKKCTEEGLLLEYKRLLSEQSTIEERYLVGNGDNMLAIENELSRRSSVGRFVETSIAGVITLGIIAVF